MKKTIFVGLFLAASLLGASALAGVEMVVASERNHEDNRDHDQIGGDPSENSAREFGPGIRGTNGCCGHEGDVPGAIKDFTPGHSEIGDPNAVSPGNLKKLIKPDE